MATETSGQHPATGDAAPATEGTGQAAREADGVEAALARSRPLLQGIFDAVDEGLAVLSPDLRILAVNRRVEQYFAHEAPLVGKRCYQAFRGREDRCEACPALDALAARQPTCVEVPVTTPGGTAGTLEVSSHPLFGEDGAVSAVIEVMRDLSARRLEEEQRRQLQMRMLQAQKLESLGVLAGGIAHDFNNLLMAILGNVDLALADLSPVSPARLSLLDIERSARRAADLSRQMLAYSGKGRLVLQPIDLGELLREMQHLVEASVAKGVVLKFNLAPGLPTIDADAAQLRQVVMNLVTNASEAIDGRSGVVSISTGWLHCDREYLKSAYIDEGLSEGRYAYLEVADTGCGMDADTRSRLFDPFFTTKFTGRGLGLAAVLGIVRSHGGTIKVYSEEGRGSTFKVIFPAPERSAEPAPPVEVWRGGGVVLLVDDEEDVRRVGRRMLERLGFQVLTATDGREALRLFAENAPRVDAVLLDLTMPHMDGEETFRELRRIKGDVAVVLSSGYNEQDVTQRFAGKGLAGFIQKPYQIATLGEKLRHVLGR